MSNSVSPIVKRSTMQKDIAAGENFDSAFGYDPNVLD
jgi:hypothetical protein